ncbi:MAG: zinc-ribbon domain-containing protein [Gammaproteobacteria bacterium]|jgi:hypothetical protein
MSLTASSNKRKIIINSHEFDSLESAARAYGISRNTVDYRLSKGWTPEEAVGLEPRPSHAAVTPGIPVKLKDHEFNNIKEAAKYYGRAYTHVIERLKHGCTIEDALGLDKLTGLQKNPPLKRHGSLKDEYPDLAKEWHPTKNTPSKADEITGGSVKKVWWRCLNEHEWQSTIGNRVKGSGCPYCAGKKPTSERNLATQYPELVKEWDWNNNRKQPVDFTPRSNKRVWWRCEKGHSWQATIQSAPVSIELGDKRANRV